MSHLLDPSRGSRVRSHRKIIFVGGVHRSGTTLLQRIMGIHSEIFAGRELDFRKDIVALRKRLLTGYTQTELTQPITASNLGPYKTMLSDMEIALIERYALRHPVVARYCLGDASPSFSEFLAMVWERLKAASIVQKLRAKRKAGA
ncbi:sulfotransferase [Roseovarius sp. S4756]|uniref:sulfotransferase n=1 Tax=Roseovarius maritimus TaxID=3342637 RepID=UPI0037276808